jgi:hypothetical protein
MGSDDWKRIQLLVKPEMVEQIDEFRRQQSDLPDRNEAMRRLIDLGLTSVGIGKKS